MVNIAFVDSIAIRQQFICRIRQYLRFLYFLDQERRMAQQNGAHAGGLIAGVSLSSFLQMLEQERKSCTLFVSSGALTGSFFFEDGVLIDSQVGGEVGRGAAYEILSWGNPSFRVANAEDRMRRIHLPLAHILLDSAKQQDEENHDTEEDPGDETDTGIPVPGPVGEDHVDRTTRHVIQSITSIAGIKHFFLLNRRGKMITQSSRQRKMGDFITYCIVSGIQMRKVLEVKGPNRIHLVLENGETLLVIPGAGMIIGLLLDENASVDEVSDKLTPALKDR